MQCTPIGIAKVQKHRQLQALQSMSSDRDSHSFLMGMPNGTATLENSVEVYYKVKHAFTIRSINHVP